MGDLLGQLLEQLQQRPDDVPQLLRIAELLQRRGRFEEAMPYLVRVADLYAKDGFFLKAIALKKHLLRLSPAHLELNEHLAELHLSLDLGPETRRYLEAAVRGFSNVGRRADAARARARLDALIAEGRLPAPPPTAKA